MARVVSASLFIYRKINNGSSVRHEYVGKYDINAKGNTFSVELVEESSKLDTSFIESRMTEEGVDPKLYEVCKGIKQMLSKHPDTTDEDIALYVHETYGAIEDEISSIATKCSTMISVEKELGGSEKNADIKSKVYICMNIEQILTNNPEASEEKIIKYLRDKYPFATEKEILTLKKECSSLEDETNIGSETNDDSQKAEKLTKISAISEKQRLENRRRWLATSHES